MKAAIHPNYVEATVTCACGNTFTTRSTKPQLRTDLCGVCHPFYTGEQRIVDSAGQVERFMKRMESASAGTARPSKRQQRLTARAEERAAQQRQAQEAAAAAAAEEAAQVDTRRAARADGPGGAEAPTIPTPIQPDAQASGVETGEAAAQR
ncbi:MAG: 50S ribosomal protein L31 [Chloroflexota bacterium]|nr:50S ribosomal protein L31 [Chloroflexota bacterium]